MKYLKMVPAAALLTAAVALVSCNKDQSKTTSAPASGASTTNAGEAIVFVNQDSLLSNYNYAKDINADIQEKGRKAQADLAVKGNAYQKEVADYQRAYATMSADQRASTEERLGRKQRELQSLDQNAQSALANEQMANNNKLYERVTAQVKKIAKEKGYKLVITFTRANPSVLYGDESLDITKAVVESLNSEYKKEKP